MKYDYPTKRFTFRISADAKPISDIDIRLIEERNCLHFERQAKYIPRSSYKILLKCALSVLPDDIFVNFSNYISFLKDDISDIIERESFIVYTIVNESLNNCVEVYRKCEAKTNIPDILVKIGFYNYTYCVFLYENGECIKEIADSLDAVLGRYENPPPSLLLSRDYFSGEYITQRQQEELTSEDITKEYFVDIVGVLVD